MNCLLKGKCKLKHYSEITWIRDKYRNIYDRKYVIQIYYYQINHNINLDINTRAYKF